MNLWSRFRLVAALTASLFVLTGCPPEFTDDTCSSDADCFVGEVCNTTTGTCQIEVTEVEPEITSFVATPNPADPNSSVTLEWTTNRALSGSLSDESGEIESLAGSSLAGGSYTFDIETSSRTFTLEVANGDNTATEQLTVEIDSPEFSIVSFAAMPNPVEPAALLTLAWETENIVAARITGGESSYEVPEGDLESGEWQTTITENTPFTLEVENIVGDVKTAETTVVVEGGQPVISEFSADPEAVVVGTPVDLTWDTTAAESIEITDGQGGNVSVAGEAPTGGTVTVNPTETTTYTLTATNQYGETTQDATVTVEAVLSIDSFMPSESTITEGDSVSLGWEVSGDAPTLTLTDGDGNNIDISGQPVASGAVSLSPTETTTYTLRAQTALQDVDSSLTVTVNPPAPVINLFEASPTEVVVGGTTTLSWDITGADSISIVDDATNTVPTSGLMVTVDDVSVTLNATRTYTLTATNAGGSDTADVTVVAGSAVGITSLVASPDSISTGQSSTITWTTANASTITLESDQGDTIDVSASTVAGDSVTVSPTVTTTYTLTAQGLGGPVSSDVTVTVQPAVSVTSFTASPTTVVAGDPVTLSWQTANATSLSITYVDSGGTTQLVNTVGKNLASDSVVVNPTDSVTYTLTADGFQGPATDTAAVTVQQPVTIDSLTSDYSVVAPGEAATISWTTSNATSVTLTDSGGTPVDLTSLSAAADSVAVAPSASETYTFEASGPAGPVSQTITIDVVDPDGITISEILADPTNTDDQRQWVEITNTGSTILDLSDFTLGAGTAAYDETLVQLSGNLAPGGCAVIGGPVSDADNGSPDYDVATDFNPDLPLTGGVALFVGPTAEQTDARTPVASIVYGGSNPNGLLGTDGNAKTDISPAVTEGSSLTRTSSSDTLNLTTPTPGQCVHIESMSPAVGSNQATGTVSITGFGFDVALDTATIGTTALQSCVETASGIECTLPTTTDAGDSDLTVSRVNEYVDDGAGGLMVSSLATAIDATLASAYLFEAELADPGASFYCGITGSSPASPVALSTDVVVTLEVYLAGETDVSGTLPAGYVVEALDFGGGVLPATIFDATWTTATYTQQVGSNAEYTATFNSSVAETVEVAFRVSPDSGVSWYYCDTNANSGSDNGYDLNGGETVTWQ